MSSPPPLLPSTITTLRRHLVKLTLQPQPQPQPSRTYPKELRRVLEEGGWGLGDERGVRLERDMCAPFTHPDPGRVWRGGTVKSSFNYLLLDPRISMDLPLRCVVCGDKESLVRAIWSAGYGVVSLHVFHNTIPVEAYTREAAIIESIGVDNLTNSNHGTYYGPATPGPMPVGGH
ncbi:hypothetical protein Pmani_037314 [Petrolisthes manimaculis]|uniref:Uncharacterized protein n=1 Tax=Petrolisthes manimaculis TaxID=1843537 RepID=A0AAE1NHZ9_9EUCA|nr:hypothetical protein Pmani_037314 [Petrolisthes manimaculis]